MNKYRRLVIGILCLLLLLSITACKVPMPGRLLLGLPRSFDAFTPVAAVEADGTRHFAWTEPMGSQQGMVYARLLPDGATFYLAEWHSSTYNEHYRNPRLVVTDSGVAFVAYAGCTDDVPGGNCSAHYSAFPKGWVGGAVPTLSPGVGGYSLSLVQRGNTVYALGVTRLPTNVSPTSSRVDYKRLAGGVAEGRVAEETGWFIDNPSGAIDSAGNLHVALKSNQYMTNNFKIGYTNNLWTTGNMGTPDYQIVDPTPLSPSISLAEGSGDFYVAYAINGFPADSIFVWRTHPAPASSPVSLSLGPATGWQVNGPPALVATGNAFYTVIFSASNSASADTEIWTYGSISSAPHQVTNDAVDDGPPVAARAVAMLSGSPVEFPIYAWRTTHQEVPSTCYGDVKVVADGSLVAPIPRTVFRDKGTCDNPGYSLSALGDRGLGVWLDVRDGSSLLEVWYSTDGVEMFIPVVRR